MPIHDGVVYAIRARTHAPVTNAQITRAPPHRMSQLPRRTARVTGDLPRLDHPAGSPDAVFDVRPLVQVAEDDNAAPEVIVDRLDSSRDVVGLDIGASRDQTRIPSDPATVDRIPGQADGPQSPNSPTNPYTLRIEPPARCAARPRVLRSARRSGCSSLLAWRTAEELTRGLVTKSRRASRCCWLGSRCGRRPVSRCSVSHVRHRHG